MPALSTPPIPLAAVRSHAARDQGRPSVVVADDHPLMGALLAEHLALAGGFRLAGTATDGVQALALCREHRPDVLVLDLLMPGLSGVEVLRALRAEALPTRAVVFTAMESVEALREAMVAGAQGFLSKSTRPEEVMRSLEKVRAGEFAFSTESMELARRWVVAGGRTAAVLTDAETTVLRRVALGQTVKQISAEAGLSESGAYRVLERLKQKLQVESAQELTLVAPRRGLISL
jgi:DNA-binding NarL/FixJ family response regulator